MSADGGDTGYFAFWDAAHDRLLFYRDSTDRTMAAVRIYNKNGQSSVPIYPVRDLQDSLKVSIWGVAATPSGGVVLTAIADYGNHQVRSLLLTYDATGALTQVWNVDPCHHHRVAVDYEGNIFAFGERHDAENDNYPLVVKYSPNAKILREFLPARSFPSGDEVVSTNPETGEHVMFIHQNELKIYVAPARELITFERSGKLRSRVELAATLAKIAEQANSGRVDVMSMGIAKEGGIVAQLQFWPKEGESENVRFGLAKFADNGSTWTWLAPLSYSIEPGRFLGTTTEGKMVFLEYRNPGVVVSQRNITPSH
jgi:hypothetical protein